jgi:hypothetical protein
MACRRENPAAPIAKTITVAGDRNRGADDDVIRRRQIGNAREMDIERCAQRSGLWGSLVHKGEHPPIIDKELFLAVQAKLQESAVDRRVRRSRSPSFLSGLIYDDRDNRMSPSHANKRGVRYRYYVSQAVLQNRKTQAGSITRASELARIAKSRRHAVSRLRPLRSTRAILTSLSRSLREPVSRLRDYFEPAAAGRFAFDMDAAFGLRDFARQGPGFRGKGLPLSRQGGG